MSNITEFNGSVKQATFTSIELYDSIMEMMRHYHVTWQGLEYHKHKISMLIPELQQSVVRLAWYKIKPDDYIPDCLVIEEKDFPKFKEVVKSICDLICQKDCIGDKYELGSYYLCTFVEGWKAVGCSWRGGDTIIMQCSEKKDSSFTFKVLNGARDSKGGLCFSYFRESCFQKIEECVFKGVKK